MFQHTFAAIPCRRSCIFFTIVPFADTCAKYVTPLDEEIIQICWYIPGTDLTRKTTRNTMVIFCSRHAAIEINSFEAAPRPIGDDFFFFFSAKHIIVGHLLMKYEMISNGGKDDLGYWHTATKCNHPQYKAGAQRMQQYQNILTFRGSVL